MREQVRLIQQSDERGFGSNLEKTLETWEGPGQVQARIDGEALAGNEPGLNWVDVSSDIASPIPLKRNKVYQLHREDGTWTGLRIVWEVFDQ